MNLPKWFDDLVHQAIIDALKIIEAKIAGRYMPETKRDETRQVYIVTLVIVYAGTILAAVAKWAGG